MIQLQLNFVNKCLNIWLFGSNKGQIPNGSEHPYPYVFFEGCRALLSRISVWNSLGEGNDGQNVTLTTLRVHAAFSAPTVVANKYFFLLLLFYSNTV